MHERYKFGGYTLVGYTQLVQACHCQLSTTSKVISKSAKSAEKPSLPKLSLPNLSLPKLVKDNAMFLALAAAAAAGSAVETVEVEVAAVETVEVEVVVEAK